MAGQRKSHSLPKLQRKRREPRVQLHTLLTDEYFPWCSMDSNTDTLQSSKRLGLLTRLQAGVKDVSFYFLPGSSLEMVS